MIQALLAVTKIGGAVAGVVKLGKIFWNLATLIKLGKSTVPILKTIVKEKRIPHLAECRELLHAAVELLRSGVIDIPGLDEEQVAKSLEEIEKEVEWPAQAA